MRFIHPILAFCLFCLLVTETVAVDSSAAVVESTFEQDLEGWTTYGDGFLLRRYPTGGNPGGYMWAHDMAWGPTNPKWAPKKPQVGPQEVSRQHPVWPDSDVRHEKGAGCHTP